MGRKWLSYRQRVAGESLPLVIEQLEMAIGGEPARGSQVEPEPESKTGKLSTTAGVS